MGSQTGEGRLWLGPGGKGHVAQWASHRIRCPSGSFRRQFTKPTTPEVVQPTAMSHTGREEESARMFCRRMKEGLTREGLPDGGDSPRSRHWSRVSLAW